MSVAREPWLQKQWHTLLGNAQSRRDFRSQLRGTRTLWLWGSYVGFLSLVAMAAYANIAESPTLGVVEMQSRLRGLYEAVIGMLAFVLVIVVPALTSGAIVSERERKSLDLIFSAPVEPKYLLVGKLISSFRYVWLLLALALPVTALGVAMGGATWQDVLSAFVLLSLSTLVMTAAGLLISSLSTTMLGALISTFVLVGGYLLVVNIVAWSTLLPGIATGGPANMEAPFMLGINPFTVVQAAPTYSIIFGVQIPNTVVALVYTLLTVRLLLFGAGSALSTFGSPETRGFRLYGLLYAMLLGLLLGAGLSTVSAGMSGPGGPATWLTVGLFWMLSPIFLLSPFLFAHSWDADRKYRDDGLLRLDGVLKGTPSGGLLYALFLTALFYGGLALAWVIMGSPLPTNFFQGPLLFLATWVFLWGLSRAVSRTALNLRAARSLSVLGLFVLVLLPIPVLASIQSQANLRTMTDSSEFLRLSLLYPMIRGELELVPLYAALMVVFGIAFVALTEKRRSKPPKMAPPPPAIRFE